MAVASSVDIIKIGEILKNPTRSLKERFRALFTLRNLGGELAIAQISNCFDDESVLLKHELAYCLGQMGDEQAIPVLLEILKDRRHHPMVRHEAAEALGAIGNPSVIDVLKDFSKDSVIEVAETCHLALGRIEWLRNEGSKNCTHEFFLSIDPAPASTENNIKKLQNTLIDESMTLFDRYRAMFALRNINSFESAKALTAGYKCTSALLRHEVGYVLGQMAYENVIEDLKQVVSNTNESEMVRHEAAEAMGQIASEECMKFLDNFKNDQSRVLAESCIIALDLCDYENSGDFQYADTLSNLQTKCVDM